MQQACQNQWCKTTFEIKDEDHEFLDRLAPTVGGKKLELPPPTLCPECRQQRRFACRNDRNYYTGNCTQCQKPLITSYSPDKHLPILCDTCFFGDGWDPLSYGKDFDFSKPFFEQFAVLRQTVPRLGIYHTQSENSDYTVHSSRNRNCYMGSSLVDCEDVHFSDFTFTSENCLDLFSCSKMELCYASLFCEESYHSDHCENCSNLTDCSYCFDCRGSENLIGCAGLRKQKNKILNKEVTKEEIKETWTKLRTDPAFRAEFEKEFTELKLRHPHPATWTLNAENCSGNYIYNSKNARNCYNTKLVEDARYLYEVNAHTTTMDCCRIGNGEMLYDCASIVDLKYGAFCNLTYQSDQLLYCDNCTGTSQCFGSFGLKKHKHCILNKQYTKEEYEKLVPKIVQHMRETGEWGEFFPVSISVFGYNESKAHEWYPLDEHAVQKNGWQWSDYELPMPASVRTIAGEQLPPDIKDIPDDILNWAIICETSGRPFKIIKQELDFYRNNELPIPHRSPKQRHYDRIRPVNIRMLFDRACGKCSKPIRTIYSAERPAARGSEELSGSRREIVYCERCYLETVY